MTAFHVIPGDPRSSVIVHVPHSARFIPTPVREGILLDSAGLDCELDVMTDSFTDLIAESAASHAGVPPWLFVNRLSRLVIDPERFPDDREELNPAGMGSVYTRTSDGSVLRSPTDEEMSGLVDQYFTPYANAFADLVDERLAAVGEVTIIDQHSYPLEPNPYELHADGPRPEVCIGTDPFHTPPSLADTAAACYSPHMPTGDVGIDSPFAGCYVPLRHYNEDSNVSAVMIELRRDIYLEERFSTIPSGMRGFCRALADLINQIELDR